MMKLAFWCCAVVVLAQMTLSHAYFAGVGKADITGPAADVEMMGYAMPAQTTAGIHFRLYARAFVIGSDNGPDDAITFVSIDLGMGSQALRLAVLEKLNA
jgi:neutral ceramidase